MQQRIQFDTEYVRRLAEGDSVTEEHFASYFGKLIRIKAAARLRSSQGADDVCQETLLRVLRNLRRGAIKQPESLGAYVNTVCNNVLLELFHRDKGLNQFPEEAPDVSSGEASAETGMLEDERRDLVRQTLQELSAKDRELIQRIFLEEHDKDTVCKELKVSRDYLRVLLHRARGRLRIALKAGQGSAAV